MKNNFLFQITIPSVQRIVKSSRKTIDLWSGSYLISHLLKKVLRDLKDKYPDIKLIIPYQDILSLQDDETADITNIVIFSLSIEKENVKDVINFIENTFKENLKDLLLKKIIPILEEKDIELAQFQIENAIPIVVGATKLDNYPQTRKKLNNYISTLKGIKFKESEYIESYQLVKKENNQFPENYDYKTYIESTISIKPSVIKGAYKCDVCGERIILGADEKDYKADKFWQKMYKRFPVLINEKEKLCGFCLGKRFLTEVVYLKRIVPSVSDISMKIVKELIPKEEIFQIFESYKPFFREDIKNPIENKSLEKLDGEWLMPAIWDNYLDFKYAFKEDIPDEEIKKIAYEIKKSLENIYKNQKIKSVYSYAVLLMDGDNMGKKISKLDTQEKQSELSKYLSEFTKKVKEIVSKHKGFLVYAGGDDVLALLPVETTLKCADEVQNEFKNFLNQNIKDKYLKNESEEEYNFTMSGGLIFAHHKLPLNYVLSEVRNAENKAKDKGKNKIHLKYIKHSYAFAETTLSWDCVKEFEKLVENADKIPSTLPAQHLHLVSSIEDKKILEMLTKYLLKKKQISDDLKEILENLTDFDLSSKIKIAKFIKSNTAKDVENVPA